VQNKNRFFRLAVNPPPATPVRAVAYFPKIRDSLLSFGTKQGLDAGRATGCRLELPRGQRAQQRKREQGSPRCAQDLDGYPVISLWIQTEVMKDV